MKLLTVGDSFTYGEELADLNSAWPYLLGQRLGYEVDNQGWPSSGNTRILRSAIENYAKVDLVIVAWSHFSRLEFADQDGVFDIWPGSNEAVHYNHPHRNTLVKHLTRYHNDVYSYQQYIINILLLQSFLKQQNKKYIMVNAFGNNWIDFSQHQHIVKLADQIDQKYFLGWPNDQMVEWTYGCPQGPCGHFLDEGHKRVADKIYEHIRSLGWVS